MSLLRSFKSFFQGPKRTDVEARFELLREAVSGTMSSFYMARDRNTNQIVGLKILDRAKTQALEARFKGLDKPSEGEIASRLSHPHVVRTLEYGLTTRAEQYLVMEFLEGPGLNSLIIGRNPGLVGRRAPLIRQAAEALSAVHKAGFIHRDICPRNFVVSPSLDTLKLIDFGLTVPATAPFMQPGNRTGTPNYMAPEVVRRRPTNQRLDIFSFGVSMYELFAFELPWPRGTTGQAAMAHGAEEPTDIRRHCPRIDPRLAKALMACLAAAAEKRPESMDQFLLMIRQVKHDEA